MSLELSRMENRLVVLGEINGNLSAEHAQLLHGQNWRRYHDTSRGLMAGDILRDPKLSKLAVDAVENSVIKAMMKDDSRRRPYPLTFVELEFFLAIFGWTDGRLKSCHDLAAIKGTSTGRAQQAKNDALYKVEYQMARNEFLLGNGLYIPKEQVLEGPLECSFKELRACLGMDTVPSGIEAA